ncbi:MAG: GHMP kinase [Bacteroidetes bacterium]|nr:GHMP kinase [Bacteroidota bacterium]MBS1541008.1 GHMP kinase [Bacteroidota bacterium]
MIITRTPFRISFVGGGSDLRSFYEQHPGAVLSTSINKYMYISSHKFFEEDKIRVKYSKTETVTGTHELQHPILRAVLDEFKVKGGLEFSSIADVPAGTGLGSSSSFTVGLLHNLHVLFHHHFSKEQLAHEACRVEIELLQEPIGKQDQYAAAMGGLNVIEFHSDGKVTVDPLQMNENAYRQLQKNLLMFYTGDQRSASAILQEQNKNNTHEEKFKSLKQMVGLVHDMKNALAHERLDDFGKILHENWILKKTLASGITNPGIENAYDVAMKNGAMGGKLLGAGGGGFLLFYCPQQQQEKLIAALKPFRKFDFTFDEEGTKLIHISDE